jgi:fatty-acyl-CoA synthase
VDPGGYDERYTEVDGKWRFADVQTSFNYVADCEEGWAEASPVDRWGLLTQRASSAGMERLVERTVTDIFDEVAAGHEGTANRFQGTDHSVEELRTARREVADGLAALGHEKGDPGAVWLPNRPEWFEAYLGFAGVGAPVVTVNTRYRTHELEYMLEDSGATTLVLQGSLLDRDFLGMLREVCPSVDEADTGTLGEETDLPLERVVVLDRDGETDVPGGAYRYEAVRDRGGESSGAADEISVAHDDPATVFYTSGTTSQPKGVLHDHRSTVTHPIAMVEWLGVSAADVALGVIPVCGVAGFDFAWSTLLTGGTLVLQPSFDAETAARAVEAESVTYLAAVGEMYEAMLATDYDLTSLERASAWLVDADDLDAIEAGCDVPVCQPYGLSEGHSHLCIARPEHPREQRHAPGGPPLHEDVELQIRDPETGGVLDPGEPGELHLRGYARMLAYLDEPERTREDVDEAGWLATGDLCELDDAGRMRYHSRIEDMLRLRGFRVAPQEVERAIEGYDTVERAQVVGVPRGDGEEVAVAFVKPTGDSAVGEDALATYLHERVADYKVPARFEIVDAFPTTPSPNGEKIQRTELAGRADDLVEASRQ